MNLGTEGVSRCYVNQGGWPPLTGGSESEVCFWKRWYLSWPVERQPYLLSLAIVVASSGFDLGIYLDLLGFNLMLLLCLPVAELTLSLGVLNLWVTLLFCSLRHISSIQPYMWWLCCHSNDGQWDNGKYLAMHWLHPLFVVFPDFHSINSSTVADFKLPMWTWSWGEMYSSILLCNISTTQL